MPKIILCIYLLVFSNAPNTRSSSNIVSANLPRHDITSTYPTSKVVISDQAAHLPRLRANIDLNREALRRSRAAPAPQDKPQADLGNGCTTEVAAAYSEGTTSADMNAVDEDDSRDDAQRIQTGARDYVKAAELEWGDNDAIERVIAGRAFDVVLCCETLHWPALDLWQVGSLACPCTELLRCRKVRCSNKE